MDGSAHATFTGREIGGCQIHRLIARGAVGALYGAIDLASGEARALKVLPIGGDSPADRAEAERRFHVEADAAARLDHPDIVRVHRAGVQGDRGYLVMDLLAGCDLRRYTDPARRLPAAVVLELGRRIALALDHAHSRGIVHRDLKPANVMVDWAASRVTLTDLGLARLADAERTRTGLVLGSPAYMAPELLAGFDASASTDLYALGVLLFQLLCGRLPFEADAVGALLRDVAQTAAPALRSIRPEAGPGLDALVRDLLAKTPANRPPNARAVAERLTALSHDPSELGA